MSTSFSLHIENNILNIGYDPLTPQRNDQIVKDILQQLQDLTESGQLAGGGLLKINGKHTIPMAYVLAHHLSHLYSAIAAFDPKLPAYVVVISHDPQYELGTTLQ